MTVLASSINGPATFVGTKMRDETIDALWFATQNEPDRVMAFGRSVAAHAEERLHALIRALKTHDGDNNGREFGLATVNFGVGGKPEWLWAMQSDIDDAIEAALLAAPPPQMAIPPLGAMEAQQVRDASGGVGTQMADAGSIPAGAPMSTDKEIATPQVVPVETLLVWAVEDGVIRVSKVMDADLQDSLVRFAARFATPQVVPKPCCQEFEKCREMCTPRADYWQGQCEQLKRASRPAVGETWYFLREGAAACDKQTIKRITGALVTFEPTPWSLHEGETVPLANLKFVERVAMRSPSGDQK